MKNEKIKDVPLTKEMVEVRIGQLQSTNYGNFANLLLYQAPNATFDALDEMFGPLGWDREHVEIAGSVYCRITVRDDKGNPVYRMDVGTAGEFEPEKSKATDSFKRAATNFIPAFRALKKAPKIRIKLNDTEVKNGANGKIRCYTEFTVSKLAYDDEKQCFTDLVIVDGNGEKRFDLRDKAAVGVSEPMDNNRINGNSNSTSNGNNNSGETCSECGTDISAKVFSFSMDKYKRPLCMNCQKKFAAAA